MYVHRRAGSDLKYYGAQRCGDNSRSVPCLLVWVRGPVEQGRHNAINDSGPDGKTNKRSDGSAGYCLKSRVQRSPWKDAYACRIQISRVIKKMYRECLSAGGRFVGCYQMFPQTCVAAVCTWARTLGRFYNVRRSFQD